MVASHQDQASGSALCSTTALLLCVAHSFTIGGMAFQSPPAGEFKFELINFSIWLSPALVLLCLRNVCTLVAIYAVPILVIFGARMYFVSQFYWLGINSMSRQKGDWAWWYATGAGMISVAVLAVWLFICILVLARDVIDSPR